MSIPTPEEKLAMIKVEPADEDELRCVETLAPGTREAMEAAKYLMILER